MVEADSEGMHDQTMTSTTDSVNHSPDTSPASLTSAMAAAMAAVPVVDLEQSETRLNLDSDLVT